MTSLSDMIEAMIKDLLLEQDGYCEISRNSFAESLNVVPSQISYVIDTRFKTQHGYLVESRRGGGGSIRIRQVNGGVGNAASALMQWVEQTGVSLSQQQAELSLRHLIYQKYIPASVLAVMRAALSDQALQQTDSGQRDTVRADVFKTMLTAWAAHLAEEE